MLRTPIALLAIAAAGCSMSQPKTNYRALSGAPTGAEQAQVIADCRVEGLAAVNGTPMPTHPNQGSVTQNITFNAPQQPGQVDFSALGNIGQSWQQGQNNRAYQKAVADREALGLAVIDACMARNGFVREG